MKRIEYKFNITSKTIGEVLRIAEQGQVSYSFKYDLKQLYDESKWTPNKNMSWYLSRLISTYYSIELVSYDSTFKQIHKYLMDEWQKSIPVQQNNDKKYKLLNDNLILAF